MTSCLGPAESGIPETDCVLATLDLQQLLDERGISLRDAVPDDSAGLPGLAACLEPTHGLTGVPGSAGESSPVLIQFWFGGRPLQEKNLHIK